MRKNHGLTLGLSFALALGAVQAAAQNQPATLVLRNGHVVTVDEARPEAQAVAIRGATILAVGSNADINKLIGPNTQVIDLQGRLVIPGFIESHGHYLGLGRAKMILNLTQAKNWEDIVNMVAASVRDVKPRSLFSKPGER